MVLFVTPYWRRLLLSLVFGGLSALLWSAELALTAPLTITFGEHRTVSNYVRHEITQSSAQIAELSEKLEKQKLRLAELPDDQTRARMKARVPVLNSLKRLQQRIDLESSSIWLMRPTLALLTPVTPA